MKWNYQDAFSRNLGLVSPEEQARIQQVRIAIGGMGGVGGVHLATLLRQGFSKFTIADFDSFEVKNFNRQYGAFTDTVGQSKVKVMAELAKKINPDADIRVIEAPINATNVDQFLRDCDVFVDGIDAFAVGARRLIFNRARSQGIPAVTAGPMGFSVSWLVFTPEGMSFDKYFGMHDEQSSSEQIIRFLVGLSPRALHRTYIDMSYVDIKAQRGPSSVLACQLCSGVMAAEVLKIALKRGPLRVAPFYQQFDAFKGRLVRGRVWFGARNPIFRLKVYLMKQLAPFKE